MKLPCLDIIIPHYNEKPEMIRHLLDSIEMQAGINLAKAIRVTIVNDHNPDACAVLRDYLIKANYTFPIEVLQTPINAGAGRARQYGIDHTELPYIMFCDADDCLYTCTSLLSLLNCVRLVEVKQQPWNYIWGNFYEEKITGEKGFDLITHDKPSMIWLHGKLWKREFLEKYNIHFHPTLRTFEDTYFGKIVSLSVPKTWNYHCEDIVYLWKRNPNSVTSGWNHDKHTYLYWRNEDYVTCTYSVLETLYPRYKEIQRWQELFFVSVMFTYFILQMGEFSTDEPKTAEVRLALEDLFARMIKEFGNTVKNTPNINRVKWYCLVREEIVNQFSFNIEQVHWNDFLKYIDKKYNIESYDLLRIDNPTYDK